MRYLFLPNYTGVFLIISLLHYDSLYLRISAYAIHLNSSKEIRNIFNLPRVSDGVSKGAPGTGNFAEGGIINESLTQSLTRTSTKNFYKNSSTHLNITGKENMKTYLYNSDAKSLSHSILDSATHKALPCTKLTETGSNLFLGVPEVIHVNGTSSIKPRKGVHYIKIVPRKGVENEKVSNKKESCFWLNENKCFNAKMLENLKCVCCEESNASGKNIAQQALEDCDNCKIVNSTLRSKHICKNICCDPIFHGIHSISTTQNILNNYLKYQSVPSPEPKYHDLPEVSGNAESTSALLKEIITENKDVFANSKKNSKLKPAITKVPYDVKIVTNLLGNTQQKVFIPIVVLLFLLPLIGILMFFLWRRAKEYWDKRYYKRMDFLIDGIYND